MESWREEEVWIRSHVILRGASVRVIVVMVLMWLW